MLARIDREDFLGSVWDYRPGEHVSFIEPTQQGKTYLKNQLLHQVMQQHPDLRYVSMMPKPRDPATRFWAPRLGLKIIDSWPPLPSLINKPSGYVLWPKHMRDAGKNVNREHLAGVFQKALNDQYWHGNSVTDADDVYILAVLLGLNMDLEEFWTAGGSGKAGLWSANQKPSGTIGGGSVSSFSYNSPTHLFIGRDPDQRNRQRFGEIGGVDPAFVAHAAAQLRLHQLRGPDGSLVTVSDKLYIDKRGNHRGPYMCVIGP